MPSLYKQTMTQIFASGELKQETTDMLIEKINKSKVKPQKSKLKMSLRARYIFASIAAAVIFCAVIIPATIMKGENSSDIKTGLEWGFDDFSGEPSNPFYAAYKSDKTEFDINDVTLTFYYASVSGASQKPDVESYNAGLFFTYEKGGGAILDYDPFTDPDAVFIKETEDFFNEQVRRRETANEDCLTKRFPFSEQLTIPTTLFKFETGLIRFEFWVYKIINENRIWRGMGGALVYYKVSGENVMLSAKLF